MSNFPSLWNFSKDSFLCFTQEFLQETKLCLNLLLLKKRCQRLKVKGQVETKKDKIKKQVMAEDGDDGMHGV